MTLGQLALMAALLAGKPAPPDGIVGFVTRGKGVTIHRQRCSNVVRMRAREPERLIAADWGKPQSMFQPVGMAVGAPAAPAGYSCNRNNPGKGRALGHCKH